MNLDGNIRIEEDKLLLLHHIKTLRYGNDGNRKENQGKT